MGLDARALLVVGVRLTQHTKTTEVTKYDPDTGKPYPKAETELFWGIEGTSILLPNEDPSDGGVPDADFDDGSPGTIAADHADADSQFLGYVVAATDSHRSHGSLWVSAPDLEEARERCRAWLQEKFDYVGPVGIYVVQYLSY